MKRFLLACILSLAALPAFAQTAVSIVPTGSDWVSKGVARTYTPANARVTFSSYDRNRIRVSILGNDGKSWEINLVAPVNEPLRPGQFFLAERWPFQNGRAPGLAYSGDGAGCNRVAGFFTIRQIQFDANGNLARLEANATHYCEDYDSPPVGIGIVVNAPNLHYLIDAPDFNRPKQYYYGDTSLFWMAQLTPDRFRYKVSGLRDVWTMDFTAPTGTTQLAKGIYLTELTAKPGVAGMEIVKAGEKRGGYGKLDIITIAYRNGAVSQLSARFYFYSDPARTKLVRSGRINFWK